MIVDRSKGLKDINKLSGEQQQGLKTLARIIATRLITDRRAHLMEVKVLRHAKAKLLVVDTDGSNNKGHDNDK